MNRTIVIAMMLTLFGAGPRIESAAQTPEAKVNGPDFRVMTEIFVGKSEDPAAKHLILFADALVYDIPQIDDQIITVFDTARGRVILLDRATQVRTTIGTEDLVKLTAQARASATNEKQQQRLGISADILPMVLDPKTGQAEPMKLDDEAATIASDGYMTEYGDIRYEVITQSPRQPTIASEYGQFADWALRLNVARRMGLAPFARMALNERVASAGQVPLETRLTIRRGFTSDRFRSTHQLIERLSEGDRKQIHDVGGMLALYKEVPFKDFP